MCCWMSSPSLCALKILYIASGCNFGFIAHLAFKIVFHFSFPSIIYIRTACKLISKMCNAEILFIYSLQGGLYVFKGKQLVFARKDEGTGDHASLDDVLNVCCSPALVWACLRFPSYIIICKWSACEFCKENLCIYQFVALIIAWRFSSYTCVVQMICPRIL